MNSPMHREACARNVDKQSNVRSKTDDFFIFFHIARLHRRELCSWKSSRVHQLLGMSNQWKMPQKMSCTIVRQCAQHLPANDLADTLENAFHGHPGNPARPLQLTEPNWSLQELNVYVHFLRSLVHLLRALPCSLFNPRFYGDCIYFRKYGPKSAHVNI